MQRQQKKDINELILNSLAANIRDSFGFSRLKKQLEAAK